MILKAAVSTLIGKPSANYRFLIVDPRKFPAQHALENLRRTAMAGYQLIFAVSSMAFLTSCGGAGGSASGGAQPIGATPPTSTTPPSPPTQTRAAATDPIIGAAATSQTFVSDGRYFLTDGGVTVRFDMATGTYRITDPANTTPSLLYRSSSYKPLDGEPWQFFVAEDGLNFLIRVSVAATTPEYRYFYSNLAAWSASTPGFIGQTAFGIPTPAGSGPSQSVITFSGLIEGTSTESYQSDGGTYKGNLQGKVALSFDAGKGTAQLTITPVLGLEKNYALSPITKTLTWSSGSATFFQPVNGDPQSKNYPVTGRFTGPAAQELIGGVSVDYVSPVDGKSQTIGAAFIAKQ